MDIFVGINFFLSTAKCLLDGIKFGGAQSKQGCTSTVRFCWFTI